MPQRTDTGKNATPYAKQTVVNWLKAVQTGAVASSAASQSAPTPPVSAGRRWRYPKTDLEMYDGMPLGPRDLEECFQWADVFLKRLQAAGCINKKDLFGKLKKLSLRVSTSFSGMGCPEMSIKMLEAAIRHYTGLVQSRPIFRMGQAFEINNSARSILVQHDSSRCVFADVTSPVRARQGHCYSHHRACAFDMHEADATEIHIAGPPCIMFSRMGRQLGTADPRYKAHEAWMQMMLTRNFPVVVFENVCEYEEQLLVETFEGRYTIMGTRFDARNLGYAASRARYYCILLHKEKARWAHQLSFSEMIHLLFAKPVMHANDYVYLDLPPQKLTESQSRVLESYKLRAFNKPQPEIVDLAQKGTYSRTELADGSLMTLTTNCRQLFSCRAKRFLHPLELLASLCIPVDVVWAAHARVTRVDFSELPDSEVCRMAGNGMNLSQVGAVVLCILLGVEWVQF